jgi:hypothetical protein
MRILNSLSNANWIPGGIRFRMQEGRLRSRLSAEQGNVHRALEAARTRVCVTKYSRTQLGHRAKEVEECLGQLQEASTWRALEAFGTNRFEVQSKSLRTALEKLQKCLDLDAAHSRELNDLTEDREVWVTEAASLLVGKADIDFRHYDRLFRQKSTDFWSYKKLEVIDSQLKTMHKAVSQLEQIVKQARRLREDLPPADKIFQDLDVGLLKTDPRTNEIYNETERLLGQLKTGSTNLDMERNIALLHQVEQNNQLLTQRAKHVGHDASIQVELWRKIAVICPRATSTFVERLSKVPLEPSGDSFAEWVSLRRSIEKTVIGQAQKTRSENASVLDDPALKYVWFGRNETALQDFANSSYQNWRATIQS